MRADGQLSFSDLKTDLSTRRLALAAATVEVLRRHRASQDEERAYVGAAWCDRNLVFASTIGTPIEPRNLNTRWAVIRQRAGLPWLRLHDLRHACATFLLAAGTDPRTVMQVLGHSQISLTMNTYAHVLEEV